MRKIEDVRSGGEEKLNVVSRPTDTYVRPQTPEPDKLTLIAQSLTKYNPALQKYLGKKAEEKRNFEEAVGIDLYNKYKAPSAEIEQMIKNGEVEGLRKLTKHHLNGIHKMRHKTLGDSVSTHMLSWAKYATIKDADGNDVPISKIDDDKIVIAAFEQEQNRYAQEITGGKYDKQLFAEVSMNRMEIARNTFIQQQAAARMNQMESEKKEALGMRFNVILDSYTVDDKFLSQDAEGNDNSFPVASLLYAAIQEGGLAEYEAKALLTEWFSSKFQNIDIDHIDRLKEVAMQLPYWDDMEFARKIEQDSQNSIDARSQRDFNKDRAKKREAEQRVYDGFDELMEKYKDDRSKVTPEDIEALRKIAGSAGLETLYSLLSLDMKLSESGARYTTTMDAYEFNALKIKAMGHRLSKSDMLALGLSGRLSDEQYKDLASLYKTADSIADAGGTKRSGTKEMFNTGKSMLMKAFNIENEDLSGVGQLLGIFNAKLAVAVQKNPSMSDAERYITTIGIVEEMQKQYADQWSVIKTQPDILNIDNDEERNKSIVVQAANNQVAGLDENNPTVMAELEVIAKNPHNYKPSTKVCKAIAATGVKSGISVGWKEIQRQLLAAATELQKLNPKGGA